MDFFNSRRAAKFFDTDLPRLIKNVGRLADVAEAAVKSRFDGPSAGIRVRLQYQADSGHAKVWLDAVIDTPSLGLYEESLLIFCGAPETAAKVRQEVDAAFFGPNKEKA